jgi:cell division protein FtsQ
VIWFLFVGAIALGWVVYFSSWFAVTAVDVRGVERLKPEQVASVAAVPLTGALISVDLVAIEERVSSLPEVESVLVERAWPHNVLITVTERAPIAYVVNGNSFVLIDAKGVSAGKVTSAPKKLLRLDAALDSPALVAAAEVYAQLPEKWDIVTISATTRDNVVVTVRYKKKSVQIQFGGADRVADKVAVANALMANKHQKINVTAPDAPTTIS